MLLVYSLVFYPFYCFCKSYLLFRFFFLLLFVATKKAIDFLIY